MNRRRAHPVLVLLAASVAGTVLFIGCIGEDEFQRRSGAVRRCVPSPGHVCPSSELLDGPLSNDGATSNDGAISNDGAMSNDGPTSNDASDDGPISNGLP